MRLLVVDDDAIDAGFVIKAFSDVGRSIDIVHVPDAQGAAERLRVEDFDCVLLDINMPGLDGVELLKGIRAKERTAVLPVIVLTSSLNPGDIRRSYAGGANAYAVKPSTVRGYQAFAEGFSRFWIDVAVYPHPL